MSELLRYVLGRLGSLVIVLLVISTITFILMHSVPGGPFTDERNLPEAVMKNIMERYHLNDPLWKQYVDYMWNLFHGDLGPSFKYEDRSVNQIIADGFPVSAILGLISVSLALVIGIPSGIIAALKQQKWEDYSVMFGATLGVSVPNFIIASLLIYVFAIQLNLFPAALWEGPQSMVLPAIALAAMPTAIIARLTRSSMLEVLSQDYIKTARAKGLNDFTIIWRHALKNSLMPVVTYLGPLVAGVFTGSFVIESIFAIPGLGKYFVASIYNRDYTVILGVTIFYSFILVTLNFLVDLSYHFLDPRIKLGNEKES